MKFEHADGHRVVDETVRALLDGKRARLAILLGGEVCAGCGRQQDELPKQDKLRPSGASDAIRVRCGPCDLVWRTAQRRQLERRSR